MAFPDFVRRYVNKMAALGVSLQQMADEFGVSLSVMQSWLAYASQKNNEYVNAHNDRIPDDVLIADWNADHPPVVVRETPFGPVPDAQASLLAAIDALLAKHFADFQKR